MLFNIIIFFIVLITIVLFLQYSCKFRESFIGNSGGIPVAGHQQYVETSAQKFNEMTNLVNLTNPSVPIGNVSQSSLNLALQTADINATNTGAFQVTGLQNSKNVPNNEPENYKLAKMCELQAATCSAFDDPDFAANCGMSFDPKGHSYTGKPHIGGKFISQSDRKQQMQQMGELDAAGQDGYTAFKPTLGTSKPGTFALTKDQCIVVKERIECQKKQSFNSPNCTQCYTSGLFHRVDPSTGRLPSTLKLFGNGMATISSNNGAIITSSQALNHNKPFEITIPATGEGTRFVINVNLDPNDNKSTSKPAYILGYIVGQTPRGAFKLDLMSLIEADQVTSTKPKLGGANIVDGFRSFVIIPGTGKQSMALSGLIPFSFLSLYDGDARTCDNGPIITQAASATFLESDPCFGKKNKPGNYTMECLQERWVELGGSAQGTGYPNTIEKANAIQVDANGNPLDIDTIVNNLYPKMVQASTGLNSDGSTMTIPQWNTVSMWGLGIPITTPCDGGGQAQGPVSQACLEYLYLNQGAQSHIGGTYTLPTTDSSLKGSINGSNTYCQPGAPLDPSTPSGKQFIQSTSQNGIMGVKNAYDQIHRQANDNTISNEARKQAVNQCYGVNIDTLTVQQGVYQGSAVITPPGPFFVAIYGQGFGFVAYANQNILNSNINWTTLGGSRFTDVAITPDGQLFETNSANQLLYCPVYTNADNNGQGWRVINTSVQFTQIATDGKYLCGVDVNNNPWYATIKQAIAGNFTQLPSVLQKIVPYNGGFICLGLDKYIWYLTSPSSSGWNMININNNWQFQDIAVDGNNVIFLDLVNTIYYMNSNMFVSSATAGPITMPPGVLAQSISISGNSIAFVDTNGNYWYTKDYTSPVWASPQWIQMVGAGGVKIRHRIPL